MVKTIRRICGGRFFIPQKLGTYWRKLLKLPEFAQHRIISLADREHSSKIPPRLKRLVDGRHTVLTSIDAREVSLHEMKQAEQNTDSNPYDILEESYGSSSSKVKQMPSCL